MPRARHRAPHQSVCEPSHPSPKEPELDPPEFNGPFRFLDLPCEVRCHVYGHLLLDPIDGIQPQYKGAIRDQGKILHPTILRVSRAIYAEAWPVLYQANLFRYNTRADCEHLKRDLGIKLPDRTFNRIQKVEVGVHPIHCCLFIRDFVKIISYVQTLGATLRTFILDVRLVGHVIREEQMDQVMQIGHSKRLASVICALTVQQSIIIKASSDFSKAVDWYIPLVSYIIEEKEWEIAKDRRVYILGEDDMEPAPFRRTWELRPKSVATEAGQGIQVHAAIQAGHANEADPTIEIPRKRPWEL